MLYTPLTKQALKICIQAHAGQVDKSGVFSKLPQTHQLAPLDTY